VALLNPYCTVAQVQEELRNTNDNLTGTIEDAINQASRFIDEYKGRDYLWHDHSSDALVIDRFDGNIIGEWLFLPHRPVVTVTEISVAGEVWTKDEDYRVKDYRIACLSGEWPLANPPDGLIEIKGTFGYQQASTADVPTGLPGTINKAAVLIAAALTGHNQKDIIGLDGSKESVIDKLIPRTAFQLLGSPRILV
jgi:hypothetical protein